MTDGGATHMPADVHQQITLNHYINIAAFTLLFYDYLLTLEWEVARYWAPLVRTRARASVPSVLFFVNRYATLLGNVPVVVLQFWGAKPGERKLKFCDDLETYHRYFVLVVQVFVGVMLLLRTYALYDQSRSVLVGMLAFGLIMVAVGLWGGLHTTPGEAGKTFALQTGCARSIPSSESTGLIVAWSAMGLFDSMIFALTLYRTVVSLGVRGVGVGRIRGSMGLVGILMRDGCLYFGVMILCNIGNIVSFAVGEDFTRGILDTFTNIVSSIMISRLMLNIRDPAVSRHATPVGTHRTHTTEDGVSLETGLFSTYWDADSRVTVPSRVAP